MSDLPPLTQPKSRFKKPSWLKKKETLASTQTPKHDHPASHGAADEAVDIFSRASETRTRLEKAEQERELRRKEKLLEKERKKKEQEEEKQRLGSTLIKDEKVDSLRNSTQSPDRSTPATFSQNPADPDSRESKRRRISNESSDIHSPQIHVGSQSPLASQAMPSMVNIGTPPAISSAHHSAIIIEDSPEVVEIDDDEDDFNSRLIREAREKRERERARGDNELNPILQLFIQPKIPNTEPLIVNRKYKQRLKDVRLAWCKHNGISDEDAKDVKLLWRDHEIWDFQSVKSRGVELDAAGHPFVYEKDGTKSYFDRFALVATTEKIIRQEREEAERKEREELEKLYAPEPEPVRVPTFKIVLRSKDYADVKLVVKSETRVEKVIGAFIKSAEISDEKVVELLADGDVIPPDTPFGETELLEDYEGDPITVDVRVK